MENSDCQNHPFPLAYNLYISGLYGASYFVFIAKNAIYCLRVYVYSIGTFKMTNFVQILLGDICNLGSFAISWRHHRNWDKLFSSSGHDISHNIRTNYGSKYPSLHALFRPQHPKPPSQTPIPFIESP